MSKVSGKCPVCGEITPVNNEKQIGYCVKCGKKIDVAESIRLFQISPTAQAEAHQASVSQRHIKREQREREAEQKAQADNAKQHIHDMFQQCSNEQDYQALRSRIMGMAVSDGEKARLLEALDEATKERLKDVLEKAQKYEKTQEPLSGLLISCCIIAGIGLAINYFFAKTWPGIIAVALAVIALLGDISDRINKTKIAEGKAAANLIAEYRGLGYKI